MADQEDIEMDAEPDNPTCQPKLADIYRMHLPPELKEQHGDVLILYNLETDNLAAEELKKAIENVVSEDVADCHIIYIRGKATLYKDAVPYVTSLVDKLDEALKFHTLYFVIITTSFLTDEEHRQMANSTFWETISGLDHRKSKFCPVYLEQKRPESLPSYFKQVQPVNMWRNGWEKQIAKIIETRLGERLYRQSKLDKTIEELLQKKGLLKDLALRESSCSTEHAEDSNSCRDSGVCSPSDFCAVEDLAESSPNEADIPLDNRVSPTRDAASASAGDIDSPSARVNETQDAVSASARISRTTSWWAPNGSTSYIGAAFIAALVAVVLMVKKTL